MAIRVRVGHSPDPDDAFMFCATQRGAIDMEGMAFEHSIEDIQTLNEWALEGRLEVTAVSCHAYAHIYRDYQLLTSGSSLGTGYGPVLVGLPDCSKEQALGGPVGIPGIHTSAYLCARLYGGDFPFKAMPFDRILEAVREGTVSAGLVIHEGQLTYREQGFQLIEDLGVWFNQVTGGLPLPLGVMVVKRALGAERIASIARVVERSIGWSLANKEAALEYALRWGHGIDLETCERFVDMYVNDSTLDFGRAGREGVREFLGRAREAGLVDADIPLDFVDSRLSTA